MKKVKSEIDIVICGEAGQGIQTIESILMQILKNAGYNSFSFTEYMSRIRGGANSTEIRVATKKVLAFVNHIDILITLSLPSVYRLVNRISDDTLIVGNINGELASGKILNVDFEKIANDLGDKIYIGAVAIGFILGLLKIEENLYKSFFTKYFADKTNTIVSKNISAAQHGYAASVMALNIMQIDLDIKTNNELKNEILISGHDALALGAIAGNCNFISSYPMSPGTGVLTLLADYSCEFDIIVEQTEDEISAINMALGAWYAGARALVTTSGGGFSLMCESLSLAGMIEIPIVVNLAQRPGPATGLPTRTEQGDLNLALYSGHGEFPRILFAPGTFEQAFYLMKRAFYFADKYQIPVIILSDQYLVDSSYSIAPFDPFQAADEQPCIIKTTQDYKRYKFTENGISPRGVPGFGDGIVCVDSDEHTEEGYITEDFLIREKMVQKRLKKLELLKQETIAPEFIGTDDYKILIVSWGTNYYVVKEALENIKRNDIAFLHFSQVYPINQEITKYFSFGKKIIVIENNASGQFASLLKLQLNVTVDVNILKYDGMPFSVEEIVNKILENL